ncbi:MAG: RNA polymerase sigma factor [Deltaproteobacteria bacterium]|nr:RNA polymerase sigma factor [Deltaproteobacteria bacterium]
MSSLLVAQVDDLSGYARFLVGRSSQADDIVQETLVRALTSFARYDPRRPLRAWLRGIALKVAHKYWDSARRDGSDGPAHRRARVSREEVPTPEESLVRRERADLLYRAMDTLPLRLREALVLHVGEQLPAEEVARMTGTSVTNVYTRASRARAMVRAFLAEQRREQAGEEETR